MIVQIAQVLLNLTVVLSCALVLVLAMRIPLRRWAGAGLAYCAWWVVPLTLAVHLLVNLLPIEGFDVLPTNVAIPVFSAGAKTIGTTTTMSFVDACMMIWLVGAVLLALLLTRQQRRFIRSLGTLTHYAHGGNVLAHVMQAVNPNAGSLVMGLLRPRIVLSSDFEWRYTTEEQRLILAHECVHVRRGDLCVNASVALLQIVFLVSPAIALGSAVDAFGSRAVL
jgi:bla regulator protein blaR1